MKSQRVSDISSTVDPTSLEIWIFPSLDESSDSPRTILSQEVLNNLTTEVKEWQTTCATFFVRLWKGPRYKFFQELFDYEVLVS